MHEPTLFGGKGLNTALTKVGEIPLALTYARDEFVLEHCLF